MGTHPIFESDFDCLTEQKEWESRIKRRRRQSWRQIWRNLKKCPPSWTRIRKRRRKSQRIVRESTHQRKRHRLHRQSSKRRKRKRTSRVMKSGKKKLKNQKRKLHHPQSRFQQLMSLPPLVPP